MLGVAYPKVDGQAEVGRTLAGLVEKDGVARAGRTETAHGCVETPAFMPVATYGAVRGVAPDELAAAGAAILLPNTYDLHERPGEEVVASLGGAYGFTRWGGPWRPRKPRRSGAEGLALRVGDDVRHNTFGEGVILDVSGSGDKTEVLVRFPDAGEKRLLLSWAPLEKI